MHTFAQKPKVPQQATPAKSTIPGRAHHGHGHDVNSILHLQRTVGNQAVQRLLQANAEELEAGSATTKSTRFVHDFSRIRLHASADKEAQPTLAIGTPGDTYEQEADRAAEQVMHLPEPVVGSSGQKEGSKQAAPRSDQPLSSHERAFFEPQFGHDFSRVRIHADSRSAEMAEALNADAFTVGRDIYFGAGKLQPRTREADQLLGHELAHVVQQSHTCPALQPKLKITGKAGDVSRAITLLNGGLRQYHVSVDKSGDVSITQNSVELDPNPQQKALADRLTTVIDDPKDVNMTVSAGSATSGGSYATGDFDIADLEVYGVAGLIHEIVEQHLKQTKGMAYGTETTGAHGEATVAESEVRGAIRGKNKIISQTANADGTRDAVIETPYTYPNGTVKTMVRVIKSNNFISMTWK